MFAFAPLNASLVGVRESLAVTAVKTCGNSEIANSENYICRARTDPFGEIMALQYDFILIIYQEISADTASKGLELLIDAACPFTRETDLYAHRVNRCVEKKANVSADSMARK
ncbi:hypothetical protein EVAR_100565_1 [Eumeta japonica]|uniref:Uncharacterized protein n=1 Tax=Eumeta variegata TaxID=151549 RepID=A0A4C1YDU5_EUMVA|nr:hypothetical protein EVAR_100565_1 [Eumeta japonica]